MHNTNDVHCTDVMRRIMKLFKKFGTPLAPKLFPKLALAVVIVVKHFYYSRIIKYRETFDALGLQINITAKYASVKSSEEFLLKATLANGSALLLRHHMTRARQRGYLRVAVFGHSHSSGAALIHADCAPGPLCTMHDYMANMMSKLLVVKANLIIRSFSAAPTVYFAYCGEAHVNLDDVDIVVVENSNSNRYNFGELNNVSDPTSGDRRGYELLYRSIHGRKDGLPPYTMVIDVLAPNETCDKSVPGNVAKYYGGVMLAPWKAMECLPVEERPYSHYKHLIEATHRRYGEIMYLHLARQLAIADSDAVKGSRLIKMPQKTLSANKHVVSFKGSVCAALPLRSDETPATNNLDIFAFPSPVYSYNLMTFQDNLEKNQVRDDMIGQWNTLKAGIAVPTEARGEHMNFTFITPPSSSSYTLLVALWCSHDMCTMGSGSQLPNNSTMFCASLFNETNTIVGRSENNIYLSKRNYGIQLRLTELILEPDTAYKLCIEACRSEIPWVHAIILLKQ